ncbi:hypothetical protein NP493_1562g00040 [Ridgeia piscesae]|uniref:Legumain prodomain domain-containing protein n=1 Tax=Ridgeia piscesae TaxID=27915 RepID=A0AAD9NC25_RIDPI|nr:hypothetical protein NP493_1562g00040 [Ridgeia piscesae]
MNSITCITFDKPLLKWNGDFKASQGIWTKNFGVDIQKNCGLSGDCGRFRVPSKIEMPYFKNNDFFDLSVSVWFKRRGGPGCWPVLVSNGDCLTSTIQINSDDDTHLTVTVRDSSGQTFQNTFNTPSQSSEWRHVVVTAHVDKVSGWGWAKVYVDGKKAGVGPLNGRMPPVWFPMFIGANGCGPCNHFYNGLMDSISFARYALTAGEVRKLYESRGLCIDACHAYRIMRNRGIPEERIVLMMYDDIAYNAQNPDKGQIFNRPNGPNVYEVVIDYKGDDVTAGNFLNILSGNQLAMNGIGTGKVIRSGPDDNVFVYYTNHGGPGILAFPTGPFLFATSLRDVIVQMHADHKYNQSSYAEGWSSHHQAWLGDEYSIYWMEDADVKDIDKETVYDQFLVVKDKTQMSDVHEYGDSSVSSSPVADFLTGSRLVGSSQRHARRQPTRPVVARERKDSEAVPAEDVGLDILRRKLIESPRSRGLTEQIEKIEESRKAVRGLFASITRRTGTMRAQATEILRVKHEITDFDCYESALKLLTEKCFDASKDQYALLQLQVLVNLCEEGVPKDTLLESIAAVCHPAMDRSKLPAANV